MKLITAILTTIALFVMPTSAKPKHMNPNTVSHLSPANFTTTSTSLVAKSSVLKWEKVAWCETHGNWTADGPTFAGGLGISRVVWNEYGGQRFAAHPGLATKEEQIYIAIQINGAYVPDQNGCEGGW